MAFSRHARRVLNLFSLNVRTGSSNSPGLFFYEEMGNHTMRCLADVLLDSDLCLPQGGGPWVVTAPDGSYSLTLANAGTDEAPPPEAVLSAQLIFEAPSFENIRQFALDKLAE